ncbi:outer membrane beta-barrel protein [Fibrisoma limi]|nr:outer membrane beta-barrel protein [Fibrisoma limi]
MTISLLLTRYTSAQSIPKATVRGVVQNKKGEPLPFATVLLQRTTDSTLVKGGVTDTLGQYVFDNVPLASYQVAVQAVGYRPGVSAPLALQLDQLVVSIPPLQLAEDARMLGEINVTAQKPFIEQVLDRTIVNVENSLVAVGGTALDVLEKAPGVMVDAQNNRISLQGREGVLVMLDGKPTYLSSEQVVTLLRNTPSNSIQRIELITNPSAKYDAAGNSGIIDIRLKRGSRKRGTSGSVTIGSGYGRLPKASSGLSLNHRQGNWNGFGSYNYDYGKFLVDIISHRRFGNGADVVINDKQAARSAQFNTHLFKAGADYSPGKNQVVGLMLDGSFNNATDFIVNQNRLYNGQGQFLSDQPMTNDTRLVFGRLATNLNYKRTFDSLGKQLTVDADYARVVFHPESDLFTRSLDQLGRPIAPPLLQRSRSSAEVTIRSGKVDWVYPVNNRLKLETGAKFSFVKSDNDVRFEQQLEDTWRLDQNRTNHFIYDETIKAVYVNTGWTGAMWSIQGGIRLEHTHSVGQSITLAKRMDRRYINLFPSLFISRKVGLHHQFRSTYSRRIDRPNYQDLNPFIEIYDPVNYYQGNPFLQPQYTDAFQLGYAYKGQTTINLGYNRTMNVIAPVNVQDTQTQQIKSTVENLNQLTNFNVSIGFPVSITKWWMVRQSVDVFFNQYQTVYLAQALDNRQLSANVRMNHSFTFPNEFTAEVTGFYNSPTASGTVQLVGRGQVSVGVQKSLWNKRANAGLNLSDVFKTMRFGSYNNFANTEILFRGQFESRVVRLSFTYNLGDQRLKSTPQRRTSSEEEQGRVGPR